MTRRNLKDPKRLLILVLVLAVVCVAFVLLLQNGARAYKPPKIAFDGASDDLEETVIVPTLDTPMPEDKNVIWCASFQIAWNEFRDDVIGEPVKIEGAQEIADRLNNAKSSKGDLPAGSYYAKAGYIQDDIVRGIQGDMARKFPRVPTPQFVLTGEPVAVAYAYLAASVRFTTPFYDKGEDFVFHPTPVSAFGIGPEDRDAPWRLRRQVKVLYCSSKSDKPWPWSAEFVIDPCRNTSPSQIILARIAPKPTLAETLAELDEKIAGWETPWYGDGLQDEDVLLVPNLSWKIEHRFKEVEGADKRLLNEGHAHSPRWIDYTLQIIEFKLDRSGAELKSRARVQEEESAKAEPRRFIFDRPFLIVMKKQGAERPFFVMWVENAELLCRP